MSSAFSENAEIVLGEVTASGLGGMVNVHVMHTSRFRNETLLQEGVMFQMAGLFGPSDSAWDNFLDWFRLHCPWAKKRCLQSMQWNNATITANPIVVFAPAVTLRLAQPFCSGDEAEHKPAGPWASEVHSIHAEAELLSTWHQSAFKSVMLSVPEPGPPAEWYGKT